MHDLILIIVSTLLVEPLQAQLAAALAAAGAPAASVQGALQCVAAAAPAVAERFAADPGWAAVSAMRLWLGLAEPIALLAETAPGCGPALRSAVPGFGVGLS